MRRLAFVLLFLAAANAHASAWTHHADGALCTFCDNSAPAMPTFTVGDVLILTTWVADGGTANTLATPSGWTLLMDVGAGNTGYNAKYYCRVAQMGDTAPSLNWTGSQPVYGQITSWSGPTAPDCSTMLHASAEVTGSSSSVWDTPAVTITDANTLVIVSGVKTQDGTPVNYFPITCPTQVNDGNPAEDDNNAAFNQNFMICYRIETTATSITADTFNPANQRNSNRASAIVSLDLQVGTTPVYSVNPAISGRTTSSIPITQTTTCADCTAYFVAETDGLGTPTCTQIKAGQGADGNAAYKSASGAITANVQLTLTLSSYTDGTVRDGYGCLNSTSGGDSSVEAIANMYKLPAFTTAITVASTSATAYTTNSKVLDGPGTVYLVACRLSATAPTVAQVEAQTGGCILDSASDDATGSMVLTIAGTVFPAYDLYFVGTYGSQHEAAVHSLTSQCLTAPTGFQFTDCPSGLTSVTATGSVPKRFNDSPFYTISYASGGAFHVGDVLLDRTSGAWGFVLLDSNSGTSGTLTVDIRSGTFANNDSLADQQSTTATEIGSPVAYTKIAVGDILVIPTTMSPSTATLTIDNSGQISYNAPGQQTALNGLAYHVASGAYLTLDLDLWPNDTDPTCEIRRDLVYKIGVAITTLNLHDYCQDVENDTLSFGSIGSSVPANATFSPGTTGTISGTFAAENEAGVSLKYISYDPALGTGEQDFTLYPIDTWTVPSCVGLTLAACGTALKNQTFGSVTAAQTATQCSNNYLITQIISQSPAAGAQASPGDVVSVTTSTGSCGIPSCLQATVSLCTTRIAEVDATSTLNQGNGCTAPTSSIYSQSPAIGTTADPGFQLNVVCR